MRILLLVKNFDLGGAEGHVCELANELIGQNHKVWLVAKDGRQRKRLSPKVQFINLSLSDVHLNTQARFLKTIVQDNKIEIIHAHQRLPIKLSCRLAELTLLPVVATVHGRYQHDLRTKKVRRLINRVITVSRLVEKNMSMVAELQSKSRFIPNGIPFENYYADDKGNMNFFYISRMDKRHSEVINVLMNEVWPKLITHEPKAKLHIVGDGKQLVVVKEWAEKFNQEHGESIICHGFQQNVNELIKNASLTFGVGRVAIENLGYGIPVLSIKNERCGKIVTREKFKDYSKSNFVDTRREEVEADAILKELKGFVEKKEFYKNEALKIGVDIRNNYHQSKIVEEVVHIYEEVALK